jgi:hypothetical protein
MERKVLFWLRARGREEPKEGLIYIPFILVADDA